MRTKRFHRQKRDLRPRPEASAAAWPPASTAAPAALAPDSYDINAASVSSDKSCLDAFCCLHSKPLLAPLSLSSRVACSILGPDNAFPHQAACLENQRSQLTETDTRAVGLAALSPGLRALWENLKHPRTVNEEMSDASLTRVKKIRFFFVSEWAEPNETLLQPSLLIRITESHF